jgi:type 1 glutamine amidotransferase
MVRCLIIILCFGGCASQKTVLILSKTEGYHHASIETGVETLSVLATELGCKVIATTDTSTLIHSNYDVIVFLNTSGSILTKEEKEIVQKFVESGGGFLGIHSAADTEYEWPWFGEILLGAWFVSHPPISESTINVVYRSHPATKHLPDQWTCTDEWYVYDRVPLQATILMEVNDHPIAWCSEIKNGRSFYTGRGHTKESYKENLFREHLRGALSWLTNK